MERGVHWHPMYPLPQTPNKQEMSHPSTCEFEKDSSLLIWMSLSETFGRGSFGLVPDSLIVARSLIPVAYHCYPALGSTSRGSQWPGLGSVSGVSTVASSKAPVRGRLNDQSIPTGPVRSRPRPSSR